MRQKSVLDNSEVWGATMIQASHRYAILLALGCSALLAASANAQRTGAAASSKAESHSSYDVSREVSVQGTVVSFTPNSSTLPLGAHVVVQTSAGTTVDAQLGDGRVLFASHMQIVPGSNIRIIGENVPSPSGTFFLARLVQQGTQVIAIRSTSGMPIAPGKVRGKNATASHEQGSAR
jgi:hypothetical protein